MPTPEAMTAAVHAYIDAFDRADPGAVRDLFASDAVVEDPVGSPPRQGHAAIHEFFAQSMQTGAKLVLDGPIRTADTAAAFAFRVKLDMGGTPTRIDVIDIFEFDEAGKIASMRAYFGPANFSQRGSADA